MSDHALHVLITGSQGFIGKYLKAEFEKRNGDGDGVHADVVVIGMDLHDPMYPVDARNEQQVHAFFEATVNMYSRIDLLINCIGIPNSANKLDFHDITDVTTESFRELVDVNLNAVFIICREFVRFYGRRGEPRPPKIINISSLYSAVSPRLDLYDDNTIKHPGYVASKHGLIGLSKYLAVLLADRGISVNCIAPAAVAETMGVGGTFLEKYNAHVPMHRPVKMQEVYHCIEFILRSDNTTGQNMVIDGGYSLW